MKIYIYRPYQQKFTSSILNQLILDEATYVDKASRADIILVPNDLYKWSYKSRVSVRDKVYSLATFVNKKYEHIKYSSEEYNEIFKMLKSKDHDSFICAIDMILKSNKNIEYAIHVIEEIELRHLITTKWGTKAEKFTEDISIRYKLAAHLYDYKKIIHK